MVFGLPFAHIPARFAEDRHRGHYIDAIDPGQVRTSQAKQPCTQVEPRRIAFLLLESFLPLLFRQIGPCASVFPLLEILFESLIALGHLLLAKLAAIWFLLEYKQQIWLPVAL